MPQAIKSVTLVVREYDEAVDFFTVLLGFTILEDRPLGDGKRWVRVSPPGDAGTSILLAKATTPVQSARIGDQTGGRVAYFLTTDDFWTDYRAMRERGVRFVEAPREEGYGTVAVFLDLYGNRWDLVQPIGESHSA